MAVGVYMTVFPSVEQHADANAREMAVTDTMSRAIESQVWTESIVIVLHRVALLHCIAVLLYCDEWFCRSPTRRSKCCTTAVCTVAVVAPHDSAQLLRMLNSEPGQYGQH